jgi:hypothetical protein
VLKCAYTRPSNSFERDPKTIYDSMRGMPNIVRLNRPANNLAVLTLLKTIKLLYCYNRYGLVKHLQHGCTQKNQGI